MVADVGHRRRPGSWLPAGARPASLVPTPDITLWVSTSGSDAAAGTSAGAAKRSLFGAWLVLSAGTYDNARIWVEAGDYYNDQGWKAVTLGVSSGSPPEVASLEIIGYGGRVRLLAQDAALTYSSAGSGAYSTTLATAPFGVLDEANLDAYGAPTWLTPQANLAAVQASGAGSTRPGRSTSRPRTRGRPIAGSWRPRPACLA